MYNQVGDNMDGILLVNKPKDFTSHDVVSVLRGILKTKKVGHTGTLDPDATGLLVIGVNKGTKIMKFLNSDEKAYQASVFLGKTTDTLDNCGEVVKDEPITTEIKDIESVLDSFLGEYTQTPPMYSAIKYKGKRLYEYARKGIIIDDIPSRTINIKEIKQTSPLRDIEKKYKIFDYYVHASKGIYIRTLSYDIGKKFNVPAYNYSLHRVIAGNFNVKDAYTLDEIREGKHKIIALSDALDNFSSIMVNEKTISRVLSGMSLYNNYSISDYARIIDKDNNLIAIYRYDKEKDLLLAENVFYTKGDYNGNY